MSATFYVTFGSLAAAAFGVVALATTFRDSSQGLTWSAICIMTGITFATVITLIGGHIERQQTASETEARQAAVLRALWDQSETIGTDDLRVVVTTKSLSPEPLPVELLDAWTLSFGVGTPSDMTRTTTWYAEPSLDPAGARLQTETVRSSRTSDGFFSDTMASPNHYAAITFSDFRGSLQKFTKRSNWNGQTVEVHASAPIDAEGPLWTWLGDFRFYSRAEYRTPISFGDEGWDLSEEKRWGTNVAAVNLWSRSNGDHDARMVETYLAPLMYGTTNEWPRCSASPLPEKFFPTFDRDLVREARHVLEGFNACVAIVMPIEVTAEVYVANRLVGSADGVMVMLSASQHTTLFASKLVMHLPWITLKPDAFPNPPAQTLPTLGLLEAVLTWVAGALSTLCIIDLVLLAAIWLKGL